jgi:hypothetical protein
MKDFHGRLILLDCFNRTDLILEQLLGIILDTEGTGNELTGGVEGSAYGYRMTDGMSDDWFVIRVKKWHIVSSFRLVILLNYKDRSSYVLNLKKPYITNYPHYQHSTVDNLQIKSSLYVFVR